MKKAYLATTIFQLLLAAGAYAVDFFTHRKMGMARWVVYKNHGWEDAYPIGTLQAITVIVIVAVAVVAFIICARQWAQRPTSSKLIVSVGCALAIAYALFVLLNDADAIRPYYFLCLFGALICIIQDAKALVAANRRKALETA